MAAEAGEEELKRIAEIVVRNDLLVLCDEAYFDMRYSGKSKSLSSIPEMRRKTVILYTFSKKYAMTGWRLGAAITCREISQIYAKLNTNDESCPNHFIQYGAIEALKGDRAWQHSVRINDQWRICFRWVDGNAEDVEIADYH